MFFGFIMLENLYKYAQIQGFILEIEDNAIDFLHKNHSNLCITQLRFYLFSRDDSTTNFYNQA
jgi:hypothetical protein